MAKVYLGDWGTYYASSGTATPSESGDWQTRWYITYEQDTVNNKTTVYVQPYYKIYTPSYGSGTLTTTITTTINGTSKTQEIAGTTYTTEGYNYKYGTTQTFTINHNEDGTANCKFSGSMKNLGMGISMPASHTWSLPTINVASTIKNNTTNSSRIDFGTNVTFTITRPNDTITHTLKYTVGGTEYTIGTSIGTSQVYIFPTSLISNYPNNAEVTIQVECISSNGTSSSTIVYLKVPDSYVPTISLNISDVGNVPSDWGIYVQGKSKIKGIITASGIAGSTIKRYSSSANSQTFSDSEFTTSELNSNGSMTINASVIDTRERTASTNQTITVYEYFSPTYVKVEVVRCDSEGNDDEYGTYGRVECSYKISDCNEKNNKSLKVTYGNITKTFELNDYNGMITATSEELFEDLDVTANHNFVFNLIDSFNSTGIPQNYVMPPSFVLVSKLAGGKGISFGQIATEKGFHSHLDSFFHKKLYVDGILIDGSNGIESGSNENGYYVKYSDGTMICCKNISIGYSDIDVSLWDGNIYFADFSNGNWAMEFTEIRNVQATNNTDQYWIITSGYTTISAGNTRLLRPNNSSEWVGADVHLMAIGKWK